MGERPIRRGAAGGHGGGRDRGRRPRKPGSGRVGTRSRSPQRRSDPARRVALEVLTRVHRDDAFANLLLPELLDSAELDRRDAGFATALTYGTLRFRDAMTP